MHVNPVLNCTFIIRSQAEYSATAQAVILRCILETPANGQHRGFTDLDSLLAAIQSELLEMQHKMIPPDRENEKF